MRPPYWLPPTLWMTVVLWVSSDMASAKATGELLLPVLRWLLPWATSAELAIAHAVLRKTAHFAEYAILAALWFRAFTRGMGLRPLRAAWLGFAASLGCAVLDEAHQALVPSRTASALDVGIDGAGTAVALIAACRGWRAALDGATGLVLWLAAVGGAAAIAMNAWAGVSSLALWLTVPAALVLLFARHRLRRKGDAPGSARVRP